MQISILKDKLWKADELNACAKLYRSTALSPLSPAIIPSSTSSFESIPGKRTGDRVYCVSVWNSDVRIERARLNEVDSTRKLLHT